MRTPCASFRRSSDLPRFLRCAALRWRGTLPWGGARPLHPHCPPAEAAWSQAKTVGILQPSRRTFPGLKGPGRRCGPGWSLHRRAPLQASGRRAGVDATSAISPRPKAPKPRPARAVLPCWRGDAARSGPSIAKGQRTLWHFDSPPSSQAWSSARSSIRTRRRSLGSRPRAKNCWRWAEPGHSDDEIVETLANEHAGSV